MPEVVVKPDQSAFVRQLQNEELQSQAAQQWGLDRLAEVHRIAQEAEKEAERERATKQRLLQKQWDEAKPEERYQRRPQNQQKAYYLHYPNFMGSAKNAIVVGGTDVGKAVLGNTPIPVGHDAVILMDSDGTPTYVEYGRYNSNTGDTKLFGDERRPTVKGGNWRRNTSLPRKSAEETDSAYLARITPMLPDAHTGVTQATVVPNVNANRALDYANSQANNRNRGDYDALMNTCATQALALVRSGQAFTLWDAVKSVGIRRFNSSALGTIYNIAKNIANGSNPPAALWQSTLWNATGKYSDQIQNENSKTYIFNKK